MPTETSQLSAKPHVLLLYRSEADTRIIELISASIPKDEYKLISWQSLNEKADVWMTKLQGYIEDPLCFRVIVVMHNMRGETNANVAFELGYATGFQKGKHDLNISLGLPVGATTAVACSEVLDRPGYPADLRQISHITFDSDVISNTDSKKRFQRKLTKFLQLSRSEVLFILPKRIESMGRLCNAIPNGDVKTICKAVEVFARNLRAHNDEDEVASEIATKVGQLIDWCFLHLDKCKLSMLSPNFAIHRNFLTRLLVEFFGDAKIDEYRQKDKVVTHLDYIQVCIESGARINQAAGTDRLKQELLRSWYGIVPVVATIFPSRSILVQKTSQLEKIILDVMSESQPSWWLNNTQHFFAGFANIMLAGSTSMAKKDSGTEKTETFLQTIDSINKFVDAVGRFRSGLMLALGTGVSKPLEHALTDSFSRRCAHIGDDFHNQKARLGILTDSIDALKRLYDPGTLKGYSTEETTIVNDMLRQSLRESSDSVNALVNRLESIAIGTKNLPFGSPCIRYWRLALKILLAPECPVAKINLLNARLGVLGPLILKLGSHPEFLPEHEEKLRLLRRSLTEAVNVSDCIRSVDSTIRSCRAEIRMLQFDSSILTMYAVFAASSVFGIALWYLASWVGGNLFQAHISEQSHDFATCSICSNLFWSEASRTTVVLKGVGFAIAFACSALVRGAFFQTRGFVRFASVGLVLAICAFVSMLISNSSRLLNGFGSPDIGYVFIGMIVYCGISAWIPKLRKALPTMIGTLGMGIALCLSFLALNVVTRPFADPLAIAADSVMTAISFVLMRVSLIAILWFRRNA